MDILDILKFEKFLRLLEDGKVFWTTKEGKKINIHDREAYPDSHLQNCINMLEKQRQKEEDDYILWDNVGEMDPYCGC